MKTLTNDIITKINELNALIASAEATPAVVEELMTVKVEKPYNNKGRKVSVKGAINAVKAHLSSIVTAPKPEVVELEAEVEVEEPVIEEPVVEAQPSIADKCNEYIKSQNCENHIVAKEMEDGSVKLYLSKARISSAICSNAQQDYLIYCADNAVVPVKGAVRNATKWGASCAISLVKQYPNVQFTIAK